jgi:hypothetical protein
MGVIRLVTACAVSLLLASCAGIAQPTPVPTLTPDQATYCDWLHKLETTKAHAATLRHAIAADDLTLISSEAQAINANADAAAGSGQQLYGAGGGAFNDARQRMFNAFLNYFVGATSASISARVFPPDPLGYTQALQGLQQGDAGAQLAEDAMAAVQAAEGFTC